MPRPRLRITMPTYNQGKFIGKAIGSIIDQTFQDWELIVVDDGSTDNTEEIVKSFKDKRITYKYLKRVKSDNNKSPGIALNYGFEGSQAKYETWNASDNLMYPDYLQELKDYLDKNKVDFVYSNCDMFDEDDNGKVIATRKLSDIINVDWNVDIFKHHYFLGICWMWRRALREKCGDFQEEPSEDYDMAMRMVEKGGRFAYLDKILGNYRNHTDTLSNQFRKDGDPDKWTRFVKEKARLRNRMWL